MTPSSATTTRRMRKLKTAGATLVGLATIVGTWVALQDRWDRQVDVDLSGEWFLEMTVDSASYRPFIGLELRFRLFLIQDGNRVTGKGEKIEENGVEILSSIRTPFSIEGTFDGVSLVATTEEQGARRTTTGTLDLTLDETRTSLVGPFAGTAANASGRARLVR